MTTNDILLKAVFAMQFAVFIPLIVGIRNRKRLDLFGVFIVCGLVASLISDAIGTYTAYVYKSSDEVQFYYNFVSVALIGLAWSKVEDYSKKVKLTIIIATAVCILVIFLFEIMNLNIGAKSYISISFSLLLGLHYYYSKIFSDSISNYLLEPKFIIATAYIFFCMTVMIIYASLNFVDQSQIPYIWTLKQVFYVLFNIIIAYGLSLYRKKKNRQWAQEQLS